MFENYGDRNFFEGGCYVQDNGDDNYTVIVCDPVDSGNYRLAICDVDTYDGWINQQEVENFSGVSRDADGKLYATSCVQYYGPDNFGTTAEIMPMERVQEIMDGYNGTFEDCAWR